MKSRPTFTVDVKKDGQVLSFWCSFLLGEDGKDETSKLILSSWNLPRVWTYHFLFLSSGEDFQIDEFAVHTGEWNENVYSADCSILDGVS